METLDMCSKEVSMQMKEAIIRQKNKTKQTYETDDRDLRSRRIDNVVHS